VTFDINYIDETEQTKPSVASCNVNQHVVVTLHDGNKVTEQRNWQSPGQSSAIGASGALGETVTPGKFTVHWKVTRRQFPDPLPRFSPTRRGFENRGLRQEL
jgi:hypothetical protein